MYATQENGTSERPLPLNRVEVSMVSHPMVVDDAKARSELGYRPVITIEQGMVELSKGCAA